MITFEIAFSNPEYGAYNILSGAIFIQRRY